MCGQKIMPGERYSREVGKYDGEFFERDLHTECNDVLNDFLYENEENEFSYDEINYWWRETRCDNCKHHYPSCDSTCKAAGKGDSEKCDSYRGGKCIAEEPCDKMTRNYWCDQFEEEDNEEVR